MEKSLDSIAAEYNATFELAVKEYNEAIAKAQIKYNNGLSELQDTLQQEVLDAHRQLSKKVSGTSDAG